MASDCDRSQLVRKGHRRALRRLFETSGRRHPGDFYFQSGSFAASQKHYTVHDWVVPGTNNAHWRVQVFWPVDLPFLVLYGDPQYRYVLYGENDRQLGWIYARAQTLPEGDYQALLNRFASLGYDKTRFVRFVQKPEQIGQPGYWSEGIK